MTLTRSTVTSEQVARELASIDVERHARDEARHVGTGDLYGDAMAALWTWRDSDAVYATDATWQQRHAVRPVSWCGTCGRTDPSEPDPRPARVIRRDGACECGTEARRVVNLPTVGNGKRSDDGAGHPRPETATGPLTRASAPGSTGPVSVRTDVTPSVMASRGDKVQAIAVAKGGHGRTVRPDGGRVRIGRMSVLASLRPRVIAETGSMAPWPHVADLLRGDTAARQRMVRNVSARRVVRGMAGPSVLTSVRTADGKRAATRTYVAAPSADRVREQTRARVAAHRAAKRAAALQSAL